MAAPESSPDLSVVPEQAEQSEGQATEAAPAPEPKPSYTAPASDKPTKPSRRGAPWWVVVVVAVIGLILFLNQYQRAEGLDARVTSLTAELTAADARLQEAQEQIAAHQTHLDRVRAGVANLSDQVAGLRALADADPLAPEAPVPTPTPAAPDAAPVAESSAREALTAPPSEAAVGDGIVTDSEGYYWRAGETGAPDSADAMTAPLDEGEREAIVRGTLGTSFSNL